MAVNNVAVWHVCNIYTHTLFYVNIKQCFMINIIIMNPKFIIFFLLHSPCLPTLFTSLLSFSFQESKPTVCRVPTSSFSNLSFLCSALGSPLHFFLIRASFSPPLCSALVSGGLRVDLVRQMVWEWQRDRKARRRGGGKRGNRQPYLVSREAGPVKSIWSSVIHFPAPQETGIKS